MEEKEEPGHQEEGVIDFDTKPIVLCQEIYNKLSANHQTISINKEQVHALLKYDTEEEEQAKKSGATTATSELLQEPTTASSSSYFSGFFGGSTTKKEDAAAGPTSADEKTNEAMQVAKSDTTTLTTADEEKEESTDAKEESATEPQLVGYFSWEHGFRTTHTLKLRLAKCSDLALHIVIGVLVNQVRYERNAVALSL